ncbi:hypothetical protein VF10_20550, partial [Nostoc linckia z13]|uniref:hypothetical protein n=1 Tax=Nostoc linckia TaxID=92942 RepID=UPI000C030C86
KHFCGQREKVSQRGLGGFPHERLANPEGVNGSTSSPTGERENSKPFPLKALLWSKGKGEPARSWGFPP